MIHMVEVSIIIVNMNGKRFLEDCLRSLADIRIPKEIILVDNGSTDGSVKYLRENHPTVIVIAHPDNWKFAKPNNDAMKMAKGKYFFLLNNDTVVDKGTLEVLVTYITDHPAVGMVGPQLLNTDGSIQRSCRGLHTLWTLFCDMFFLDRFFPSSRLFASGTMGFFDHTKEQQVDHIMAAALLVRAEAVREVGYLDECMTIYGNDMDWSRRFGNRGWTSVYLPNVRVLHYGGGTTDSLGIRYSVLTEMQNNLSWYYYKYYGLLGLGLSRLFQAIGFLARLILWGLLALAKRDEETWKRVKFFSMCFFHSVFDWSFPHPAH